MVILKEFRKLKAFGYKKIKFIVNLHVFDVYETEVRHKCYVSN
jgi:hypothetical protein